MKNFLETIIGQTDHAKPVAVATPEWPDLDGAIYVRRLTPVERVEFFDLALEQKATAGADFYSLVTAYCACDGDGKRGFANDAWKTLRDQPGAGSAVERIYEEADALNFLSDRSRETIKKKYAATPACEDNCVSPEASV